MVRLDVAAAHESEKARERVHILGDPTTRGVETPEITFPDFSFGTIQPELAVRPEASI